MIATRNHDQDDEGVWIHQQAWMHLGRFEDEKMAEYAVKKEGNGVYAFVIDGSFTIEEEKLSTRDAMAVYNVEKVRIESRSEIAEILLIEVPLQY